MCNDYRLITDLASIAEDFADLKIKIDFPEGTPNVAAREDVRITDMAPIVRMNAAGGFELVNRRWSWPGRNGRPVYNFRSEGRSFDSHRCLILADGFYEFTDPADAGQKRLDKWLGTLKGERWFGIAGIWREYEGTNEAFTMLTMDAGPDIAPYHHRQIVPLSLASGLHWLNPVTPPEDSLAWLPEGSIEMVQVYGSPPGQKALTL